MIEGGKPTAQSFVPAFYLSVDGKEYGPFASQHEGDVRGLYRSYKGITPRYVTVRPSELVPVPTNTKRKDEQRKQQEGFNF